MASSLGPFRAVKCPCGHAVCKNWLIEPIAAVVAQAMVDEGKFTRIEPERIPPTMAFDDQGAPALFAVVVPLSHLAEYEDRVKRLRA